jgi:hypothetical protein
MPRPSSRPILGLLDHPPEALVPVSPQILHLGLVPSAISGRVLSRDEIAPLCNIAICEFRVSFRGSPAY